ASVGAVSLRLATSRVAHAQTCESSGGGDEKPVPWEKDDRIVRPRRPAAELAPAEIKDLKAAYCHMRGRPTTDKRNFVNQANSHCFYCATQDVHENWKFLVWHRGLLYFHERILGKLLGDMTFRLPYWDWDDKDRWAMPSAYASAEDNNPLF